MGSDSGKSGGSGKSAKTKGPSLFDNFAEDLGNVLSGNATSAHSAYDKRNASTMSDKTGRPEKDYLRGGYFGPGGRGYNPSALHEAGQGQLSATARDDRDTALSGTERRTRMRALGSRTQVGTVQHLGDAVGPLGSNMPEDVTRIQGLLVAKGRLGPDAVTGYLGTKMVEVTKAFQRDQGLAVDDQIELSGPAEKALIAQEPPRPAMKMLSGAVLSGAGTRLDHQLSAAKAAMARGDATKAEQVRNIERYTALKDKHADAIAKANTAAAKTRSRVKNYLASIGDEAGRDYAEAYQNHLHTHYRSVSGMPNPGLLGDLENAYVDATAWHFEKRDLLNEPLPHNEQQAIEMGFERYPDWQSVEHQNDQGRSELKYGHPDGREVVFDGDTGEVVSQNRIKGTYNYVTPPAMTDKRQNLKGMIDFLSAFPGHALLDYAPYILAGNKRGDG